MRFVYFRCFMNATYIIYVCTIILIAAFFGLNEYKETLVRERIKSLEDHVDVLEDELTKLKYFK